MTLHDDDTKLSAYILPFVCVANPSFFCGQAYEGLLGCWAADPLGDPSDPLGDPSDPLGDPSDRAENCFGRLSDPPGSS